MEKKRFILKLKNSQPDTNLPVSSVEQDMLQMLSKYKVQIIDDTMLPKMLLVETRKNLTEILSEELKNNWSIFPEQPYEVPDSRKRIKLKK